MRRAFWDSQSEASKHGMRGLVQLLRIMTPTQRMDALENGLEWGQIMVAYYYASVFMEDNNPTRNDITSRHLELLRIPIYADNYAKLVG